MRSRFLVMYHYSLQEQYFKTRNTSSVKSTLESYKYLFLGYEMAAMQTQILQDGFDGLSNSLSSNQINNRGQQINGLSNSNGNSVINIQSPTGFVQEKSPTPRVINISNGNIAQSQGDAHNPRSGT